MELNGRIVGRELREREGEVEYWGKKYLFSTSKSLLTSRKQPDSTLPDHLSSHYTTTTYPCQGLCPKVLIKTEPKRLQSTKNKETQETRQGAETRPRPCPRAGNYCRRFPSDEQISQRGETVHSTRQSWVTID